MTHKMIKSRIIRRAFARELWQARTALRLVGKDQSALLRFGMESGFWAVQKEFEMAGI